MNEHRISGGQRMQSDRKGQNLEGRHWRSYQKHLRAKQQVRESIYVTIRWTVLILPAVVLLYFVGNHFSDVLLSFHKIEDHASLSPDDHSIPPQTQPGLKKSDIQALLDKNIFAQLEKNPFEINEGKRQILIETSIAPDLQQYIQAQLDGTYASRIGVVVMDPSTGSILAMASHTRDPASQNPCTDPTFPAASIFKIVTAAAAIESRRLRPDTLLQYNGRKYTLYRSQINETTNKYTHQISLRDSFAQSVNPVFGKLGALQLQSEELEAYAEGFGFNKKMEFELGLPPSRVHVPENEYLRAEIACGFNRETRISPLHGAVLAASLVNGGKLLEPALVNRVSEKFGETLFVHHSKILGHPIKTKTADLINELMKETIRSGTCKKAFRGYQKDKVLSRLIIGGKTGSIGGDSPETRFDWFVGYAAGQKGKKALAVSIVVVHEKFIGIRASDYARKIMKYYFQNNSAKT
jgi:peptidoglycan glycosyltransferase